MKKLSTLIVVSVAIVSGILSMLNSREEVAEASARASTVSEPESAQVPVDPSGDQSAKDYQDHTGTSTAVRPPHNSTYESASADFSSTPGDRMDDIAGTSRSEGEVEGQGNATGESFAESTVAGSDSEPSASRDAPADDRFDYSKIQHLYVLKGDVGHGYARFPVFLQYRDMIVEKMSNAGETNVDFTKMIYEIRAVGIGEETTLFVGDSWMDDGEKSAELSEEELKWLRWAYESPSGSRGLSRQQIEASIRYQLEQQRDPAWQPAP